LAFASEAADLAKGHVGGFAFGGNSHDAARLYSVDLSDEHYRLLLDGFVLHFRVAHSGLKQRGHYARYAVPQEVDGARNAGLLCLLDSRTFVARGTANVWSGF